MLAAPAEAGSYGRLTSRRDLPFAVDPRLQDDGGRHLVDNGAARFFINALGPQRTVGGDRAQPLIVGDNLDAKAFA